MYFESPSLKHCLWFTANYMTLWPGTFVCAMYTLTKIYYKLIIVNIDISKLCWIHFRNVVLYILVCDSLSSTSFKLKLKPLIVIDAWFCTSVCRGNPHPWSQANYGANKCRGRRRQRGRSNNYLEGEHLQKPTVQIGSLHFEIRNYSECKIWYSKSKSGNQVINYKVYMSMYMHAGMYLSNSILL